MIWRDSVIPSRVAGLDVSAPDGTDEGEEEEEKEEEEEEEEGRKDSGMCH